MEYSTGHSLCYSALLAKGTEASRCGDRVIEVRLGWGGVGRPKALPMSNHIKVAECNPGSMHIQPMSLTVLHDMECTGKSKFLFKIQNFATHALPPRIPSMSAYLGPLRALQLFCLFLHVWFTLTPLFKSLVYYILCRYSLPGLCPTTSCRSRTSVL